MAASTKRGHAARCSEQQITARRNQEKIPVGTTNRKESSMKTKLVIVAAMMMIIAISPSADAGPHGGGFGSGNFGSGGRGSGFAAGGSRAAPAFSGGAVPAAPAFRGAYFTGRTVGGVSRASHFYYGRPGMSAVTSSGFRAPGTRPTIRIAGRTSPISSQQDRSAFLTRQNARVTNSQIATTHREPNRAGSIGGRNQLSNPRTSTAANHQSFVKNHASERHDGNWHRDWDRHRAHFHHNRVFVFVDGFWWGLYPWDFYGTYPYDYYAYPYDYNNPYDYSYEYPYDYSDDYPYEYYDPSSYDNSGYDTGTSVREVQSELAKLGYYHGPIDGIQGDATEAALARYQQDHDLSVTGTVTSDTLQMMGL
jgi:hypothetical protein